MNRILLAALIPTASLAMFACTAETKAPDEAPAKSEAQAVKEIGTLPAGPDAQAELGVDHWTIYQTAKDVLIVVGKDKANVTRHRASITGATASSGVYYVKEATSESVARNLKFTATLDEKGAVVKTDGDPSAGYGTVLLRKDLDEAALHQEKYGWFACISWSVAAIGACGLGATGCFTAGVFTGGASCYFGGVACVGAIGGAIDACIHRDVSPLDPLDPSDPNNMLVPAPPCADGDPTCCIKDDNGACVP